MTGRPTRILPLFAATSALLAATATAEELPEPAPMQILCDGLHRTQVVVDGFQRDWEDEARPADRVAQLVEGEYRYDWTGPNDASFKIWCRYTENSLYFAVVGRDDVVVAPDDDDGDVFEIMLRVDGVDGPDIVGVRLPLWDLDGGLATPTWSPGTGRVGEVRAARGEVAPRETGYFLEFNVPYIADPNLREPFAPIAFFAAHRDVDHDSERERLAVVATAPYDRDDPATWGTLAFTGPDAVVARVAHDRGRAPDEASTRVLANVGAGPARELAFVLDGHLFVSGPGLGNFAWTSVLVEPNEDYATLGLDVHDIDADGDDELFYRWRRSRRSIDLGGTIYQEFVTVYDLRGESLVPLLSQEVANELDDGSRFEMAMELRERADRAVVRFRRPAETTLERDRWIDIDAEDSGGAFPALTPWGTRDRIDWDRRDDGTWVVLPPDA